MSPNLISSLRVVRNIADNENDYIPECDSQNISPDPKHEIDAIYNFVIAEERLSADYLHKRIGKLTPFL